MVGWGGGTVSCLLMSCKLRWEGGSGHFWSHQNYIRVSGKPRLQCSRVSYLQRDGRETLAQGFLWEKRCVGLGPSRCHSGKPKSHPVLIEVIVLGNMGYNTEETPPSFPWSRPGFPGSRVLPMGQLWEAIWKRGRRGWNCWCGFIKKTIWETQQEKEVVEPKNKNKKNVTRLFFGLRHCIWLLFE